MAATNSTSFSETEWFPTDISAFDLNAPGIKNEICNPLASWSAGWLLSDDLEFPYPSTSNIVLEALQEYWKRQHPGFKPNPLLLYEWFSNQTDLQSQFIGKALNTSVSPECAPHFCPNLPWMGVSDLAGRGMVATYFIQCGLVTIFFAIHAAGRFGWKPHKRTQPGRIMIAVQESSRPFLDATLLFSIALSLAALGTLSRFNADDRETTTMTTSSVYIALYGVFPAIVLHSCAAPHLRRRHERRYLWSFIAILTLVVSTMYFVSTRMSPPSQVYDLRGKLRQESEWHGLIGDLKTRFRHDKDNQLKWEMLCLNQHGVWVGFGAITGQASFLVVSAVLCLTFVTNIFRIPFLSSERSYFLKRLRERWWMISAAVATVIMWASVILFFILRKLMNNYTGDTNQDEKWTFGQILATATWAPVLMEVFIIWREGPEKGLSGLMSDRFEVYEVADVGGERVIKSTTHVPVESGPEEDDEIQISVTSPILSDHGNLSDSTVMESLGAEEMQGPPANDDSEPREKRRHTD